MLISDTALSLNVPDPRSSSDFLSRHFGYKIEMEAPGFVSMSHPGGGVSVVFLQTGLPSFKPAHRNGSAGDGILVAFVVDDIDRNYQSVRAGGAKVITEPETEPWGERYCQFEDPNGIIIQLVQWV